MRKGILLGSWFWTCLILLGVTIILLLSYTQRSAAGKDIPYNLYSALPTNAGDQGEYIDKKDARAIILRQFFERNKSPLISYTDYFIWVADRYKLDFRLLPAIAMQETNAAKKIDDTSHNAWGFANGLTVFKSWPDAIEKVAQTLKFDYIDKGLATPEQIMPKYAPPSVDKGGPWARGVQQFIKEME